jgi:hypothetical protein
MDAGNGLDRFGGVRNPETKYLIGVEMKIKYMREIKPEASDLFQSSQDLKDEMKVQYDLELDKDLKVLGGEWRRRGLNNVIRFRRRQGKYIE